MIDIFEVKKEIREGKLLVEMREQNGMSYLLLRDAQTGEGICLWSDPALDRIKAALNKKE